MKNRFLYSKTTIHYDTMRERFAYIPVTEQTRVQLKESKRELSYDEFLKKVVDNQVIIVGGKL